MLYSAERRQRQMVMVIYNQRSCVIPSSRLPFPQKNADIFSSAEELTSDKNNVHPCPTYTDNIDNCQTETHLRLGIIVNNNVLRQVYIIYQLNPLHQCRRTDLQNIILFAINTRRLLTRAIGNGHAPAQ